MTPGLLLSYSLMLAGGWAIWDLTRVVKEILVEKATRR